MGSHIVGHETKLDKTLLKLRKKCEADLANQKLVEDQTETHSETLKNYKENKIVLDNIFTLLSKTKKEVHNEKKVLL
jgi:hypothetical protein